MPLAQIVCPPAARTVGGTELAAHLNELPAPPSARQLQPIGLSADRD
jgi:hypothetical protein